MGLIIGVTGLVFFVAGLSVAAGYIWGACDMASWYESGQESSREFELNLGGPMIRAKQKYEVIIDDAGIMRVVGVVSAVNASFAIAEASRLYGRAARIRTPRRELGQRAPKTRRD